MKRSFLLILLFLFTGSLLAQTFSNKEKILISGRIDSLIRNYNLLSNLKLPEESEVSIKTINKFKKLFTDDAMIFDDIVPNIDKTDALIAGRDPYKLVTRNKDDYIEGLLENFKKGIDVHTKKINIDYNTINNKTIHVAIGRTVEGVSIDQHHYFNDDTLKLEITVQADNSVKIKNVFSIGSNFKCLNDDDLDGIINTKDECPEKGLAALKGCPDSDNDGLPNRKDDCPTDSGALSNGGCPATTFAYRFVFSGSAGYQLNKHDLSMPDPLETFYNREGDIDSKNSEAGDIINPGYKGSVNLSANIAYYFGKKKKNLNKGVSFGFTVSNYSAEYSAVNTVYQYKAYDGETTYRRILSLREDHEKISFTLLNIPLLFRYKGRFGDKWAFEFSAGPSYISILASNSESRVTFNEEGIYQGNSSGVQGYNPNYDPNNPSINDVLLTQNALQFNSTGDPNTFFQNLAGLSNSYDFVIGDLHSATTDLKPRSGLAFNGGADIFYHLGKKLAVKAGLTMVFGKLSNSTGKTEYKMIDKSTDPYNSYYNAKTTSTYSSFGLGFGVILGL